MKYFMLIMLSVFIGIPGTSNHIGIHITICAFPITKCFNGKKHSKEGTGIVFAASKYCTEKMNGTISAESEHGKYSTFSLLFIRKYPMMFRMNKTLIIQQIAQ